MKISLQSIEIIKQCVSQAAAIVANQRKSEESCGESDGADADDSVVPSQATSAVSGLPISSLPLPLQSGLSRLGKDDDPHVRLWFPTLYGLREIIMTCDLEVRTRFLSVSI